MSNLQLGNLKDRAIVAKIQDTNMSREVAEQRLRTKQIKETFLTALRKAKELATPVREKKKMEQVILRIGAKQRELEQKKLIAENRIRQLEKYEQPYNEEVKKMQELRKEYRQAQDESKVRNALRKKTKQELVKTNAGLKRIGRLGYKLSARAAKIKRKTNKVPGKLIRGAMRLEARTNGVPGPVSMLTAATSAHAMKNRRVIINVVDD